MSENANQIQDIHLKCKKCGFEFSQDSLVETVLSYGIVFLVGHRDGYLGWSCRKCENQTTNLIQLDNEPFYQIINDINNDLKFYQFGSLCYHSFPFKFSSSENDFEIAVTKPLANEFQSFMDVELAPDRPEIQSTDLYSSYVFGTPMMGPAISVIWYDRNQINHLINSENTTGKKAFPRYLIYDPIYTAIENFCWRDRMQFDFNREVNLEIDINEILSSPAKRRVSKCFDFLTILDTIHLNDLSVYKSKNKNQTIITPSPLSSKGIDSVRSTQQVIKGLQHEKFSQHVWSAFHSEITQDLLNKMADDFISDYLNLICRVDCTFGPIWNLKEVYLQNLYDAVSSKHKRQKIKEKSKANQRKRVKEAEAKFPSINIISEDPKIDDIKIFISKVAPLPLADSLLIIGERGTGKELFAGAFHQASNQKGELVKVDCGTIPEKLFESELFGHIKGAYTGADRDKKGVFDNALNGTLFFDEIGNLPLNLQPKLLRALQDRQYSPVGSSVQKPLKAKFIFATNKNLLQMVEDELFMPDLYDRFSRPKIEIPPLRKRKTDFAVLSSHFISKYDSVVQQDPEIEPIRISKECLKNSKDYDWPGNARELEQIIKEIVLIRQSLQDRSEITPSDLPAEITNRNKKSTKGPAAPEKLRGNQKLTNEQIQYWMTELNGNKTHVAKKLGVTYHTILRRSKMLGI